MSTIDRVWPDDVPVQTSRDGIEAIMDGRYPYMISRNALMQIGEISTQCRILLTEFIRDHGGEPVEILTDHLPDILARRRPTAKQSFDRMMLSLCRRSDFQTSYVVLRSGGQPDCLMPLLRDAGVGTESQLDALCKYAEAQGFITWNVSSTTKRIAVEIPGLIYTEDLQREWTDSVEGFVAMWFGPELQPAYDYGIAPAVTQCGFMPVRVDNKQFNNKIDDEIIAAIRRARFLISDFSCGPEGARGGVYFEAGFALALDKQVIFTVREQDLDRVHFDTRQFNHIVWADPDDLRHQLVNRIGATIPINRG